MRLINPVLVVSIVILSSIFLTAGYGVESENGYSWDTSLQQGYVNHVPIRINNDSEFMDMASTEGWDGDGSSLSPFLIENYSISADGYGYGIYIGNTTLHFIIEGCYVYHATSSSMPYFGGSGIILYNVSNALISGNRIESNSRSGIYMDWPHNTTIISNQISSNHYGAYILHAHEDIHIFNNTFHVNRFTGVYIHSSTGVKIANNTFKDNRLLGAYLYVSSYIDMENNTFEGAGVYIGGNGDSYWNTHRIDTSNTVNGKPVQYIVGQSGGSTPSDAGEIIIVSTVDYNVENVNIGHTSVSIMIGYSERITIKNCTLHNDSEYGLYFYSSDESIIENVTLENNFQGLNIYGSYEISMKNSTLKNNLRGIYLYYSQNIEFRENTFEDNNIIIYGMHAEDWDSHTIDTTNTVNGKPIMYISKSSGGEINGTFGELIIASSHNILVDNVSVVNGDCGLLMGFSSHLTVRNSSFTSQEYYNIVGDHVYSSMFFGIIAEDGKITGAIFRYSDDNLISNSSFSENNYGMMLYRSDNNVIRNNTFSNNFFHGINIQFSSGNKIYHNNFLGNNPNAYDSSNADFWNASYPTGGNYWSDYTGDDNDNDGVGDSPYIKGNVVDNYPLMTPVDTTIPEITWLWMITIIALILVAVLKRRNKS